MCRREDRGDEKEGEESERDGTTHVAVFGCICSLRLETDEETAKA